MSAMTMAGYAYGAVAPSPVRESDFAAMQAAAGFDHDDAGWLGRAGLVMAGREGALVDLWRARITAQPALAAVFAEVSGAPDEAYKAAIRLRFVQWVRDTLSRPFDQMWLDYQHEIGRRHTPAAKNRTDAAATPPVVPLRYLLAFAPVIFEGFDTLLSETQTTSDERAAMSAAWRKAVMLTLALWARAYADDDLW